MADVQRYDNYIDGQWVASDRYRANVNPSDLSDVIGEYAQADAACVEQAIAAARRAFPAWASFGIQRAPMRWKRSAWKSSPAAKSSARCWPARRARPCRKPSAKSPVPATSSSSSPANACASWRDAAVGAPGSASRSPASRWAWSA